jgi:putative phosphoribosyl transferase
VNTTMHRQRLDAVFFFRDRWDAGRELAHELRAEVDEAAIVVGLASGGAVVAAAAARELELPFDVVTVEEVRHPRQPEYAVGAAAPAGMSYLRMYHGLSEQQLATAVATARAEAAALDRRLHRDWARLPLAGRTVVLVDDGLATGSRMTAAVRWARTHAPKRVVAAAPVGTGDAVDLVLREADTVVCPHVADRLIAVGIWYADFSPVGEDEVAALLDDFRDGSVPRWSRLLVC